MMFTQVSQGGYVRAEGPLQKLHAQKGQKLLAQGSALGYFVRKPVAL